MEIRDNRPKNFQILIEKEGWMQNIYTGDWEQNERLNIVRMWYIRNVLKPNENIQRKQSYNRSQFLEESDEKGQTKLL
jgi:hypothetical protein